jgi:hypothetical protein
MYNLMSIGGPRSIKKIEILAIFGVSLDVKKVVALCVKKVVQ